VEDGTGSEEGDQFGCVDFALAGLCGLDERVGHAVLNGVVEVGVRSAPISAAEAVNTVVRNRDRHDGHAIVAQQ